MKRVAINGFGRIGRAFVRLAFGHPELEIVAINDPFFKLDMARYLLINDSVYGKYSGTMRQRNHSSVLGGARARPAALGRDGHRFGH